ncbi:uncharacterized protein LOC142350338 [Convolutriloba macropyga]|uniref:uncharacterized protein LOC142350338 n=1 Tax=Convolutriloba macropyga TaxID=536237 RepID=UPI003F525BA4
MGDASLYPECTPEIDINALNSWDRVKSFVIAKFKLVKESNFEEQNVRPPLEQLDNLQFRLHRRDERMFEQFCDLMNRLGLIQLCVKFMEKIPIEGYFKEPWFGNVQNLLGLIVCTVDWNKTIRNRVTYYGLHRVFRRHFKHAALSRDKMSNENAYNAVYHCLTILYDTAGVGNWLTKPNPDNLVSIKEMRNDGVIDDCFYYTKSSDAQIATKALMALSFMVTDDKDLLETNEKNLKFICDDLLCGAIKASNHHNFYGQSVDDVLNVVVRIICNEKNCKKLIKLGILDKCFEVLTGGYGDSEIREALIILYGVALVDKRKIADDVRFLDLLKKCKSLCNSEISNAAAAVLIQCDINDKLELPENALDSGTQILISYSAKDQRGALSIQEKLVLNGNSCSVNANLATDSLLQRGAEAIENARVILCCLSKEYFENQFCQSEAQYAYKLKKKMVFVQLERGYEPRGWVGMLIGVSEMVPMYDSFLLGLNLPKLMRSVDNCHQDLNF